MARPAGGREAEAAWPVASAVVEVPRPQVVAIGGVTIGGFTTGAGATGVEGTGGATGGGVTAGGVTTGGFTTGGVTTGGFTTSGVAGPVEAPRTSRSAREPSAPLPV